MKFQHNHFLLVFHNREDANTHGASYAITNSITYKHGYCRKVLCNRTITGRNEILSTKIELDGLTDD